MRVATQSLSLALSLSLSPSSSLSLFNPISHQMCSSIETVFLSLVHNFRIVELFLKLHNSRHERKHTSKVKKSKAKKKRKEPRRRAGEREEKAKNSNPPFFGLLFFSLFCCFRIVLQWQEKVEKFSLSCYCHLKFVVRFSHCLMLWDDLCVTSVHSEGSNQRAKVCCPLALDCALFSLSLFISLSFRLDGWFTDTFVCHMLLSSFLSYQIFFFSLSPPSSSPSHFGF